MPEAFDPQGARLADVKVDVEVNKPKVSKFSVRGKPLAETKKDLDLRDEWGLYDATQNFKSSARTEPDGNVISVTMVLNPVIQLPEWSG